MAKSNLNFANKLRSTANKTVDTCIDNSGTIMATGGLSIAGGYVAVGVAHATNSVALVKAGILAYYCGLGILTVGAVCAVAKVVKEDK